MDKTSIMTQVEKRMIIYFKYVDGQTEEICCIKCVHFAKLGLGNYPCLIKPSLIKKVYKKSCLLNF